jgi:hypothetical protein
MLGISKAISNIGTKIGTKIGKKIGLIKNNKPINQSEKNILYEDQTKSFMRKFEIDKESKKDNRNLKYILKKFNNDIKKDNSQVLLYKLIIDIFYSNLSPKSIENFNTYLEKLNIQNGDNSDIILYKKEQKKKIVQIAKAIYSIKLKGNEKTKIDIYEIISNIKKKENNLNKEIDSNKNNLLNKLQQISYKNKNDNDKILINYLINTLRNYKLSDDNKFRQKFLKKIKKIYGIYNDNNIRQNFLNKIENINGIDNDNNIRQIFLNKIENINGIDNDNSIDNDNLYEKILYIISKLKLKEDKIQKIKIINAKKRLVKAIDSAKLKNNEEEKIINYNIASNIGKKRQNLNKEIDSNKNRILKNLNSFSEENYPKYYENKNDNLLVNYLINTLRNYKLSDDNKFKNNFLNKIKNINGIDNDNSEEIYEKFLYIISKLKLKEDKNKIINAKKRLNDSKNNLYRKLAHISTSPETQQGLLNFSKIEYYMYNEKLTGNIDIKDLNELCPYFYVNGIFNINPKIKEIFDKHKEIYKTGIKDENFRLFARQDGINITDTKQNNNNKILDMGKIIDDIKDFNYTGSYLSNIFEQKILTISAENKSKIKPENIEKYINQEYFDIWCQEFNNIDTLCVVKDGRILHKYVKSSNDKITKLTSNNRIIFTKKLLEKKKYHSGGGIEAFVQIIGVVVVVGLGWLCIKKLNKIEQKVNTTGLKEGVIGKKLYEVGSTSLHEAETGNSIHKIVRHIGLNVQGIKNVIQSIKSSQQNLRTSFSEQNHRTSFSEQNHRTSFSQPNRHSRFENLLDQLGPVKRIENVTRSHDQRPMNERLKEVEIIPGHVFNRINNSPKWTNAFAIKNIFLLIILLAAFYYPVIILGLIGYNIYLYGTWWNII